MQTAEVFDSIMDEIQTDQGGSETAVRFDEIIEEINGT